MMRPVFSAVMAMDSTYSVALTFIISLKHVDLLKLKQPLNYAYAECLE